jgi:hypothetical protein
MAIIEPKVIEESLMQEVSGRQDSARRLLGLDRYKVKPPSADHNSLERG